MICLKSSIPSMFQSRMLDYVTCCNVLLKLLIRLRIIHYTQKSPQAFFQWGCLARYWSLSSAIILRWLRLSSTRLSFRLYSCIICLLTVMSSYTALEFSSSANLLSDELLIGDEARILYCLMEKKYNGGHNCSPLS